MVHQASSAEDHRSWCVSGASAMVANRYGDSWFAPHRSTGTGVPGASPMRRYPCDGHRVGGREKAASNAIDSYMRTRADHVDLHPRYRAGRSPSTNVPGSAVFIFVEDTNGVNEFAKTRTCWGSNMAQDNPEKIRMERRERSDRTAGGKCYPRDLRRDHAHLHRRPRDAVHHGVINQEIINQAWATSRGSTQRPRRARRLFFEPYKVEQQPPQIVNVVGQPSNPGRTV